jgi:hypothetical protein
MGRNEEASTCLARALKLNDENDRAFNWKAIVEKGGMAGK